MSTYKLIYFNFKALGEPIRFLLSYLDKEFEDVRIDFAEWPEKKNEIPYSKLPVLEIDGKPLTQSSAICRFLAKQADLAGKDDLESLYIDIAVDTITDLRLELVKYFREADTDIKEVIKEELITETIPFYYAKFDEQIAQNEGYLASNSLSWADLYLAAFLDSVDGLLDRKCAEDYKNIQELINKVMNLPKIKEWINKRPETKM